MHRPLPFASLLQNIAPITFVKVPLRSSCADLHTCGSLDTIGDYTRPHASFKGSISQITRSTCLPRATAHLGFSSRAPMRHNFRSCAFTRLKPPADVITDIIHISPRCAVANVTCLRLPLTSSFDSEGLTVDLAGLIVDFSPGLTFAIQVLLT